MALNTFHFHLNVVVRCIIQEEYWITRIIGGIHNIQEVGFILDRINEYRYDTLFRKMLIIAGIRDFIQESMGPCLRPRPLTAAGHHRRESHVWAQYILCGAAHRVPSVAGARVGQTVTSGTAAHRPAGESGQRNDHMLDSGKSGHSVLECLIDR